MNTFNDLFKDCYISSDEFDHTKGISYLFGKYELVYDYTDFNTFKIKYRRILKYPDGFAFEGIEVYNKIISYDELNNLYDLIILEKIDLGVKKYKKIIGKKNNNNEIIYIPDNENNYTWTLVEYIKI